MTFEIYHLFLLFTVFQDIQFQHYSVKHLLYRKLYNGANGSSKYAPDYSTSAAAIINQLSVRSVSFFFLLL